MLSLSYSRDNYASQGHSDLYETCVCAHSYTLEACLYVYRGQYMSECDILRTYGGFIGAAVVINECMW